MTNHIYNGPPRSNSEVFFCNVTQDYLGVTKKFGNYETFCSKPIDKWENV